MAQEEAQEDGALSAGSLEAAIQGKPLPDLCYIQVISGKLTGAGRVHLTAHDSKHSCELLLEESFNGKWNSEICVGTILEFQGGKLNNIAGRNILIPSKLGITQKECNLLYEGAPPPLVTPPAPVQKKSTFGARSGFGGNNAFGSRPSNNNAFGSRKPRNNAGGDRFAPVKSLNPFMKSFKIKVRVTNKQDIRHWKNAKGEGKLFNCNFIDAEGTEIQGTAFNEAVDALFPQLEKGKVYIIKKTRVKISNKRFTHIKHEYSLDLAADTEVTEAQEDSAIQQFHFDFKKISDVQDMKKNDFVDLIGVCTAFTELQEFTSKQGKELKKVVFTIADTSSSSIECTLWGDAATAFDGEATLHKVVAMRAAKVSEWSGRSITVNDMVLEPDIPETQQQKTWYQQNQGNLGGLNKLTTSGRGGGSNDPPICANATKTLGMSGENAPEYFNSLLTVAYVPNKEERNPWYPSCPSEIRNGKKCMKKVMDNGEGNYRCESCDQSFNSYIPRWVLKLRATDHTNSVWLSAFDETAEKIMGVPAKEAETMKESDPAAFQALFDNAVFSTYNMRIRAKKDNYNDEERQRLDIMAVEPIKVQEDMKRLIKRTRELLA